MSDKVEVLENEISHIKERVEKLEKEIKKLESDLSDMNMDILEKLNSMNIAITSIQKDIKLFSKIPAIVLYALSVINIIISILLTLKGVIK